MSPPEFIDAVKIGVHDAAIAGMETSLESPSGRSPAPSIIKASHWFNSLKDEEKDALRKIISLSVHSAVFGMLTILDGVRAVEDREDKGRLVLDFVNTAGVVRLNDPNGEMLHDIYQSRVYNEVFGNGG